MTFSVVLLTDSAALFYRMAENDSTSQEFLCIQDVMDKVLEQIENQLYTAYDTEEHASVNSCTRSTQHQQDIGAFTFLLNNVGEGSKTMTAALKDSDHIPSSCPIIQSSKEDFLSEEEKSFLVFLDDMRSLTTKDKGADNRGRHLSDRQSVKLRFPSVEETASTRGRTPPGSVRDTPLLRSSSVRPENRHRDWLIPPSSGHVVGIPSKTELFSTSSCRADSLVTTASDVHEAELGSKPSDLAQMKAVDLTEDSASVGFQSAAEKISDSGCEVSSSSSVTRVITHNTCCHDGEYTDEPELAVEGSTEGEVAIAADEEPGNNQPLSRRDNETEIDAVAADPSEVDAALDSVADDTENSTAARRSSSASWPVQGLGVGQSTRNEYNATAGEDLVSDRQKPPGGSVRETGVNMGDFNRCLSVTMFRGGQTPRHPKQTDCNMQKNDQQHRDEEHGRPLDAEASDVDVEGKAVHSDSTEAKQTFQTYKMSQGNNQYGNEDDDPSSTPCLERRCDITHVNIECTKAEQIFRCFELSVPERHLLGQKDIVQTKQDICGSPVAAKQDEIVHEKSRLNQDEAWIVNDCDSPCKHLGSKRKSTICLGYTARGQIDDLFNASAALQTDNGFNTGSPGHHSSLLAPSAERQRESTDDKDEQEVPDVGENVHAVGTGTESPFNSSFPAPGPRGLGGMGRESEQLLVTCSKLAAGCDTEGAALCLVPDELSALSEEQHTESAAEASFYDEDDELKGTNARGFMFGSHRPSQSLFRPPPSYSPCVLPAFKPVHAFI